MPKQGKLFWSAKRMSGEENSKSMSLSGVTLSKEHVTTSQMTFGRDIPRWLPTSSLKRRSLTVTFKTPNNSINLFSVQDSGAETTPRPLRNRPAKRFGMF